MNAMRMARPSMIRIGQGILLGVIGPWTGSAWAGTQLPVPCAPGTCGTSASSFVTTGKATAAQSGKVLTVDQISNTATLNWSSFNVSAGGKVVFQQPSSNAIALNRIYDANPSSIFGAVTANGQIYLINANGFLFGATSTVNVAGLLASSLNITDANFAAGILAPLASAAPALAYTDNAGHPITDSQGNPLQNTGSITVQSGAELTAASGGRILLAAPTVQNAGTITAPNGQIVLAAGQSIFLQASDDPSLRGLIVEVDGSGTATNQPTGVLSVPTGNATLVGLAVNQDGRISATTSVSANGSVTLQAADTVKFSTSGGPISAQQGGQLELGAHSSIDILPDYADTATAVDAQAQLQSTITLNGEAVLMHGGSIDAPSGALTVVADANPSLGVQSGDNSQAKIRIDAGTSIDLAGSDAELPMAANLVTVQLRSNEFANDPTQRNGALRGDTVTVDVRADGGLGTSIADVSSAIAAVGRNIAQRTETGGTVRFLSEGDIVFNPGASINVSGGATTYLGGTIQTTELVGANGQLYDIASASPLLTYRGVVNPTLTQTYDQWGVQEVVPTPGLSHYESTYVQGAAAGSIQFAAPSLVLDGSLKGSAVNGALQRGPVGTAVGDSAAGGTLIIGDPAGAGGGILNQTDFLAPPVLVTAQPYPIVVADNASLPAQTLQLPAALLTGDGFTTTQIYTNTSFTLPAGLPLQLPAGASFAVQASRVDIDSSITALGGNLSFATTLTSADQIVNNDPTLSGVARLGIGIGAGVALNVSGQWTNDSVLAGGPGTGQSLQNGGSIALKLTQPGDELSLGNNVALTADGGAWLTSSGTLTYGSGGDITLDASPAQSAVQFGQAVSATAFGAGTAAGGSFSLTAPRIEVLQGTGSAWTTAQSADDLNSPGQMLFIFAPLFSDEGFSSVTLSATGAVVSAAAGASQPPPTGSSDVLFESSGTRIVAQSRSLQLDPGYESLRSGGTILGFSTQVTLPEYLRQPVNVALNVVREDDDFPLGSAGYGTLDIQAGASITTDPGASISVSGQGDVVIAGTLRAPGGNVAVQLAAPTAEDSVTSTTFDPNYLPNLGIDLAPTALIDVSGGAVLTPNLQGLLLGKLRGGGSVDINAERGTVVLESGSMIDIAGGSAMLDIANASPAVGYTRELVGSAGGSLVLGSVESIVLLGSIEGTAGVGSGGTAAAGSLEVDLTRSDPILGQPDPLGGPMQIQLLGSTVGTTNAPLVNLATLGVTQILNSGIDALTLAAGGQPGATAGSAGNIYLDTDQPLTLAREIVLDSRSLSVGYGLNAALSAPFVELGNSQKSGSAATAPIPTAGAGTLSVSAQQITLQGNVALQGIAATTLTSRGDVQLQGQDIASTAAGGREAGSLITAGNLTIDAARVYPDSFTAFTLESVGTGGVVAIGQTAASPGTPLSAGGSVSISADDIVIGGSLLAPFGQISLAANHALTLANGSLVSVSGAGVDFPFGQTQDDGAQWIYSVPGGNSTITAVPTKQVSLTAPNITVQSAATINLQGGGDLYAYEWVPGTGGTVDALAGTGSFSGLYAILPAQRGQAAPYDPQNSATSATQTVYLSGGAGLAAGFYSLLPARYALQSGADLIEIEPSFTSAIGGKIGTLADGTPVIAGYLSFGSTGLHTGSTDYEGFAIYPGSYGQELAAYNLSNASSYFGAVAALAGTGPVPEPADAGTLTFAVVQSLDNSFSLQGSVLTAAASGGRGALVNISAPDLEITAGDSAVGTGNIAVSGSVLQSWNASSLTLGGIAGSPTTSPAGSGTVATDTVAVTASSVTVDSGVDLAADQILLVAQQSIDLKQGASLSSTSGRQGKALVTLPALEDITLTNAAGAVSPQAGLLAVSDLALPVVTRTGSVAGAGITLDTGSSLASGGALAVDAPGSISLAGTLKAKGASWSLSSDSVAFVGPGTSADSLNLTAAVAADLQQAGAARISSQGAIDLNVPVSLGATSVTAAPTLSSLTLLGTAINNESAGNVIFGGTTLTLEGASSTAGAAPTVGSGSLGLVADTLNLGPNVLSVSGFARTEAQVAGAVHSTGTGGLLDAGDLAINAVELNPGVGSQATISTTGTLVIGAPTAPSAGSKVTTQVGGALTLSANAIQDAGVIAAPSGIVSLAASGGDLDLAGTAAINAAGTLLQAVDRSAPSPGGSVLLAATGNVELATGSTVNVAGEQQAPAGSVSITGGGTVALAGTLKGSAGSGGVGGSFSLDAGELAGGLTPLATSLMSGGFSDAVNVRARTGDLDLTSAGTLSANSITLTADSGAVSIAGVLSAASGAERGSIDLSAGTGVTLAATGQLHADGAGSAGQGGEIVINSTCAACSITLDPGSVITASGAAQAGELVLRAPALTATNDVAINSGSQGIGADVSQVGQVIVEPVLTFGTSSASVNADLATDVAAASTYLTNAGPVIAARFSNPNVAVQAGVELQDANPADTLTLTSLDLSTYSDPVYYGSGTQPQVINLSVRAAGAIAVNGAISDGFVDDPNYGLLTVSNVPSASMNIVAGADLTSANPLSTVKGSNANLTLLNSGTPADGTSDGVGPAVIRTGTGDINLAASGSVVFGPGTAVYTGGEMPANVLSTVGLNGSNGTLLQSFGTGGGAVRVTAGVDVIGTPIALIDNGGSDNDNYSVAGWQLRQGGVGSSNPTQAQYGVNFAAFDWNIGALGGGDVSIVAGRDITNISAATADSLVSGANTLNGIATLYGAGGGVVLTAGGDIGSAQVYVAQGMGTLTAGGGLTNTQTAQTVAQIKPPVGSAIALGDSEVSVWARNSVQVDAIYDPTLVSQGSGSGLAGEYYTYGPGSAVSLSSTTGSVTLELDTNNDTMSTLVGAATLSANSSALLVLPPNLSIQALQSDVIVSGSSFLYPATNGQLSLFAGRDITANGGITMADSFLDQLPTAATPDLALSTAPNTLSGLSAFQGDIHVGDATPALITAGRDIDSLVLSIPKAAEVVAGRDINNLQYAGQNTSTTDTTLIAAGRDFLDTTGSGNSPGVQLGGPGSLDVVTGRNLNLGVGDGITTVGDLANANLPNAQGANVSLMVGYGSEGADLSGFLRQIIAPSATYQSDLVSFVEQLTGEGGLTFAAAEAQFSGLSTSQQSALIDEVFFNELLLSGRAANSGSGVGFKQGYAAIAALYPGSSSDSGGTAATNPYFGDLTLTSSQVYTYSGGNISILVPGGQVNVGLANPPAGVAAKSASQLGIVAEGTGNVDIYSQGDVNVNQSRIFTLGGGNILIWSNLGSIDAGNGSKSSLSVPPPVVLINANCTISLDFAGSLASGSGIRTIQTEPDIPPGDVDLDAPVGTVNAGDAGIGAAGNINIAAAHVIGVSNINFGGTATGVPPEVGNLSAALSGVSSVASSATTSAETAVAAQASAARDIAPLAQNALSWLDVFVTGLGEENCKPDDVECLERQKKASP